MWNNYKNIYLKIVLKNIYGEIKYKLPWYTIKYVRINVYI